MSVIARQNTMFVAEDWTRVYEALENVDFRAYDYDNLVQAMYRYLQANYAEQYNDWVSSSEFVTKIEILAWLSQNIAFRVDLNTRENFLATAERRDSLIRLAQNIGYKMNRVRSATGMLKLKSIRTDQDMTDSSGVNIKNKTIVWNDPRDADWFERFVLILNNAFIKRTQFGSPLSKNMTAGSRIEQYVFDSAAPISGAYRFNKTVNGVNIPFDMYNGKLDDVNGIINEIPPNPANAFNIFYLLDGQGFNSPRSGFFLPFVQGNLSFQDESFTNPEVLRTVDLTATNINNDDFFIQQLDAVGGVVEDWTQVDTTFGEGVSFNTLSGKLKNIYEVDTLLNDAVRVKFGDGTFGRIPSGRFRFWYRTANPTPTLIDPSAIQNQTLTIPYVSGDQLYHLTMTYSLEETVSNGAITESNFDIRTRAGKVFYTQNRMITAQDYNNFYLKDNSIQKVKTVNRSFVGQSRYSRLTDTTGLYQNIKHVAEDGRLYQDDTKSVSDYRVDTYSVDKLIAKVIRPLIRQADKNALYFNQYPEIALTGNYKWTQTSEVAGQSRGNITAGGVAQVAGSTATNDLKYVTADSVIRFDTPTGETITVDRVIETGNAPNGIILRGTTTSARVINSVFPAMRNSFTDPESIDLKNRLASHVDFGIGWNQSTQSWVFIDAPNLDKTSTFSIATQGDTSGSGKDAAWMILVEFLPNVSTDTWRISDRGMSLFFESAREVDFVFANSESIIDPESGKSVRDSIILLPSNESRNSLFRRGLSDLGAGSCNMDAYSFIADGSNDFVTPQVPLDAATTVVLLNGVYQVINVDYTIVPAISGYSVHFTNAPAVGDTVLIYYQSQFVNGSQSVKYMIADGVSLEYDLGVQRVNAVNVVAFLDGIQQASNIDFGVGDINGSSTIIFNQLIPAGVAITVYVIHDIDNNVILKSNFVGDSSTQLYTVPSINQTNDTVLVALDGVVSSSINYAISSDATNTRITFNTAPPTDVHIRIITVVNQSQTQSNQYQWVGDDSTNLFVMNNNHNVPSSGAGLMVTIDGVLQDGPWSPTPQWTITGNNSIIFATPPVAGEQINAFYITGTSGIVCITSPTDLIAASQSAQSTAPPPIDIKSGLMHFFGQKVEFTPSGVIRHVDGYVNKNGLMVNPVDANRDGTFDSPFIFRNLVIQDGITDLVLWEKVQEFGFNVWSPISKRTTPRGTYGISSVVGNPSAGDSYDPNITASGSIHYDVTSSKWLVADAVTSSWILAPDQTKYRALIGRDDLSFMWTHYAPEANRIDPSKSNIMNVYLLTTGYNTAYRNWLTRNGNSADEPIAETSEQLRIQYVSYNDFKPISDAIIYYPSRYKPLFGKQAVAELQATFKIIQTAGSTLSESDLKLKVLSAIDTYFSVDRWEFGEKFYFTELVAFVHARVAPDLQSMVIVPKTTNQAFGRLFQVRAEPDELFISAASPEDIQVVKFFTDAELRVGTLV